MPALDPMTRRLLSLLLVAWFALLAGEPEWLSPCPSHGAGVMAAGAQADASGGGHGSHGGHGAHSTDAPAGGGDHGCNCPGMGCGSSGATLPSATASGDAPLVIVAGGSALVDAAEFVPVAVEHLLPFATAPPAGSSPARRPASRLA